MEVMENFNFLTGGSPSAGQFSSIFSQLLKIFSRSDFERAVKKHKADRAAKGFDCWTQFVAMLFCQVGRAHSLREICGGLASVEGKLIWALAMPRRARPFPMPTRIVPMHSSKKFSANSWSAAVLWRPRSPFVSRTSSIAWMLPSSIFVCRPLIGRSSGAPRGYQTASSS